MSIELEDKIKDLKVRIFDGAEALENAVKEKAQVIEVLVKIAKAVGFDPEKEQITYDQIVDKVAAAATALEASKTATTPAAETVATPAATTTDSGTAKAESSSVAPVTAETPVQ